MIKYGGTVDRVKEPVQHVRDTPKSPAGAERPGEIPEFPGRGDALDQPPLT